MTITIACNATTGKIINSSLAIKKIATEALSYFVAGYDKTESFKNGKWDGRSTMFDWVSDKFPVGLLNALILAFDKEGYKVTVARKALPEPLGKLPKTLGGFSYTDRYDYQWETIKQLEQRGIMVARLATGAGKTFAAALAIARINRPTLILTKRQPLMYQFVTRLRKFGFNPGLIGDGREEINKQLTVGMSQTLCKKLDEPFVQEYLGQVEFIIGEEAHEIGDDRYWSIIQNCPNAYYRMALTATPFMKDKSESNMKLLGAFGSVGIDVSEKLLIDRGINAKPIIKYCQYAKPMMLRYGSNYQKAVYNGITHCTERNEQVIKHAQKAVERRMPVLVLVERQEHGKLLEQLLKASGMKTRFIFGESDAKAREQALKDLEAGKIQVLIGSTIVDVGIDVPAISLVILAGGGKEEVRLRQRIGRGLRSKDSGPNICFILDFEDSWNEHLHNHYLSRRKVITGTPGYRDGVLKSGDDFPWELFE